MPTTQPYLTVEQAVTRLQLNVHTVRRLLRDGKLPGRRVGGSGPWRIDPEQLDAHMRGEWPEPEALGKGGSDHDG